jgi:hypothetical protein
LGFSPQPSPPFTALGRQNVVAHGDASIANEATRPDNQRFHLLLRLAAPRATVFGARLTTFHGRGGVYTGTWSVKYIDGRATIAQARHARMYPERRSLTEP